MFDKLFGQNRNSDINFNEYYKQIFQSYRDNISYEIFKNSQIYNKGHDSDYNAEKGVLQEQNSISQFKQSENLTISKKDKENQCYACMVQENYSERLTTKGSPKKDAHSYKTSSPKKDAQSYKTSSRKENQSIEELSKIIQDHDSKISITFSPKKSLSKNGKDSKKKSPKKKLVERIIENIVYVPKEIIIEKEKIVEIENIKEIPTDEYIYKDIYVDKEIIYINEVFRQNQVFLIEESRKEIETQTSYRKIAKDNE